MLLLNKTLKKIMIKKSIDFDNLLTSKKIALFLQRKYKYYCGVRRINVSTIHYAYISKNQKIDFAELRAILILNNLRIIESTDQGYFIDKEKI